MPLVDDLKWDPSGLVPMIVQDHESKDALMVAWVNRKALAKTMESGRLGAVV